MTVAKVTDGKKEEKKNLSQADSSVTHSMKIAQSVYGEFGNVCLFYVYVI